MDNKLKRLSLFGLVFLLVFSLGTVAFAAEPCLLKIETGAGDGGITVRDLKETVTVQTLVTDNPGFRAAAFGLVYDGDYLEPTGATVEIAAAALPAGPEEEPASLPQGVYQYNLFNKTETGQDMISFSLIAPEDLDAVGATDDLIVSFTFALKAVPENGETSLFLCPFGSNRLLVGANQDTVPAAIATTAESPFTILFSMEPEPVLNCALSVESVAGDQITVSLLNGGETERTDVVLMAAAYDSDGRMLAVAMDSVSVKAGDTVRKTLNLPLPAAVTADHIHAFALESGSYQPLAAKAVYR